MAIFQDKFSYLIALSKEVMLEPGFVIHQGWMEFEGKLKFLLFFFNSWNSSSVAMLKII